MRTFGLRGFFLALLTFALAIPTTTPASTIGLYTDQYGSSCSFSGNDTGPLAVYVVVKPDAAGIRGMRFSAPIPACLGATFVNEVPSPYALTIGESQAGLSASFGFCATEPTYVLQINYFRTSTTACCEFPVLEDPHVGLIEGINCAFNSVALVPVTSHFNANASCPCANEPQVPSSPSPPNNSVDVAISPTLSWIASDPDGDPLNFDVYFGDTSPPPLIVSHLGNHEIARSGLSYSTQYYWRVVARDIDGAETSGPEWTFTTRPSNQPPNTPTAKSPLPNALNVPLNSDLQWLCTDPDGDPLKYDVYFGTQASPPLVAGNVSATSYDVGTMPYVTRFYWKIVAHDDSGGETSSAVWTFVTEGNPPPTVPSNPSPAHQAQSVPLDVTLSWTCTDDTPGLTFDVYLGTSSATLSRVASNIATNSYAPDGLAISSMYYWKIVARDVYGAERTGPLWVFHTVVPPAPLSPNPPDNGFAGSPLTLKWVTNDPNGLPIHCDVYFGSTNPPPQIATGIGPSLSTIMFEFSPPGDLVVGERYYWRVYAYDSSGGSMGPVWSFTAGQLGDVDRDGSITIADAVCALRIALADVSCAGAGAAGLADVNCENGVTPRDALCIHRQAIGESCPFCGQSALLAGAVTTPLVTRSAYWRSGSTLFAVLAVTGVANLEAFSFVVTTPPNAPLVAALRRGATGSFTALDLNASSVLARVGGYSLSGVDASTPVDFIELRFTLGGSLTGTIRVDAFADDLSGAGSLIIDSGGSKGGGDLPVMFSRFDAIERGGAVRVAWELQNEDAMESYTIYRTLDGGSLPNAIVHAAVTGTTGSYLDQSVDAGKTYRYEMMVRTTDGDEFRSPIVTVEIPGIALALGANHPNPFNPQTTIPYTIPVGGAPVHVRLVIYDTSGRMVRVLVDEDQSGGARDVIWRGNDGDGKPVTSGVYFCVLQVGNERRTQKLVLLK